MPYEIHGFRIKTALNEYQDSLLDQKSATIPSLTHNQIQCLQELVSNMPESLHNSQDLQYTLAEGVPLPRKDTTTQITTGSDGGFVLWTSSQLIEILAHFSRERIPERTIQAKVSAVWGYCEVTDDVSDLNDSSLAHKTAPTTLDVVSSSSPVPIPVSRSAKDSGFEQATELWVKAMDKQDGAQARFIENVSTHAAGVKSTWLREKIYGE
jgi:catalase